MWLATWADSPGERRSSRWWLNDELAAKATAMMTTPKWTIMPPLVRPTRPRQPWRRVANTT